MSASRYRALLNRFVHKVSRILIQMLVVLFVLLILAQIALSDAEIRLWISKTYRLEGYNPGATEHRILELWNRHINQV